jgi:ABC-2 type transport system permease protein
VPALPAPGAGSVRLAVRQTFALTARQLLALWRQPWFVAITLVQPIIWLHLFGAMFKKVVEIPGFHDGSYIELLTPGIVVMSALFSAGWHGMGLINMLERGAMDRFLVSPLRPSCSSSRSRACWASFCRRRSSRPG